MLITPPPPPESKASKFWFLLKKLPGAREPSEAKASPAKRGDGLGGLNLDGLGLTMNVQGLVGKFRVQRSEVDWFQGVL